MGFCESGNRRRDKNDYRDCQELLTRMLLDKLPEAWIAPPPLRELREVVRHRAKLVSLRTGLEARFKAVMAKHCLQLRVHDLWGVGPAWLDPRKRDFRPCRGRLVRRDGRHCPC
jgi:hypothetical protein